MLHLGLTTPQLPWALTQVLVSSEKGPVPPELSGVHIPTLRPSAWANALWRADIKAPETLTGVCELQFQVRLRAELYLKCHICFSLPLSLPCFTPSQASLSWTLCQASLSWDLLQGSQPVIPSKSDKFPGSVNRRPICALPFYISRIYNFLSCILVDGRKLLTLSGLRS